MIKTRKNIILNRAHKKPILIDVFYTNDIQNQPIVLFCHGYKGFKDWGPWNLMAEKFANAGCCFIKFNFSHNGGTIDEPIDFPDLEAFGNNNYSKELDDLNDVLNWIEEEYNDHKQINLNQIVLIGHSRGGGIVTIKAEEDQRITKVISIAGVSDYGNRFPKGEALEQWKKVGVYHVLNGRTKQNMPHYYQYYEDFKKNEEQLTISRATSKLKIPHLIIHGDNDNAVDIKEAYNLNKWNPNAHLKIIKGGDHVFKTKHPWLLDELTEELQMVIDDAIHFIKENPSS